MEWAQGRVAAPSFLESESFIEIKDAVNLLDNSNLYTCREDFMLVNYNILIICIKLTY
jgi:hypothetical protein